MTICVAARFNWNYGGNNEVDIGKVALVMSDRALTAGDVEYEPHQQKLAFVTNKAIIAVAGDISVHSEALIRLKKQVGVGASPSDIAMIYSQALLAVRRQQAENVVLAPLGLNTDTFLAQLNDYPHSFVEHLISQLQRYEGDANEALIVGSDSTDTHVIWVDSRGGIRNMADIGFAAIGTGASHAQLRFMQSGYVNSCSYPTAVTQAFAAKRAAEMAPGVGRQTDAYMVFRTGVERLRPDVFDRLQRIYEKTTVTRRKADEKAISQLTQYIKTLPQGGMSPVSKHNPENTS